MVAVSRTDVDLADLNPLKDRERNINPCMAKRPDFAVKISKSFYGFSFHGEDEVSHLNPRLFCGTPRRDPYDKDSALSFF